MSKNKSRKHKRANKFRHGLRPFWAGTISFGLVSVPVYLYPASRRLGASLRMLDEDGTPLSRKYYCPKHDREVHPEHILRGYRVDDDEYVIVRDDELENLQPRKSRDIDLRQFIDADEVPPIYFERAYFLTPSGESNKAYRLLAEVMQATGRAGIATFVMRDKEYLVAIFAQRGILRAETLRFADEVRSPDDIGLPDVQEASSGRANEFRRAIKKLTRDELARDDLEDEFSGRLRKLIEKKRRSGTDIVEADTPASDDDLPPATEVDEEEGSQIDLLETIRRSLQGKASDGKVGNGKPAAAKKSQSPAAPKPSAQTRQQLYEEAQRLNIPGRSKMTKAELARAIASV